MGFFQFQPELSTPNSESWGVVLAWRVGKGWILILLMIFLQNFLNSPKYNSSELEMKC